MAHLAAKLDGLHLLYCEERGRAEDDSVESGHGDDDGGDPTHVGIVEIELWKGGELLLGGALFDQLPTPPPHPDRNLDQAEDEDHRQDDIGEQTDVRVVEPSPQLRHEKDDNQEPRKGGEHDSRDGEGVVGVVEEATEEFLAVVGAGCHGSPRDCDLELETAREDVSRLMSGGDRNTLGGFAQFLK